MRSNNVKKYIFRNNVMILYKHFIIFIHNAKVFFAFQLKFYVKMPLKNRTQCLKFDVHFLSKQFAFQTESKLSNARTQSFFTQRVRANFKELNFPNKQSVQVNLCQKPLFLHQLTHNKITDCSLLMKIVSSEYLQSMLCTKIVVLVLF